MPNADTPLFISGEDVARRLSVQSSNPIATRGLTDYDELMLTRPA